MFGFRSGWSQRKSLTAVTVTVFLATSALAGCGSSGSGAASDSATAGSINWWGWTPEIGVSKQYIAAFNKVYPNIKVNYKQVKKIAHITVPVRKTINMCPHIDVPDNRPHVNFMMGKLDFTTEERRRIEQLDAALADLNKKREAYQQKEEMRTLCMSEKDFSGSGRY